MIRIVLLILFSFTILTSCARRVVRAPATETVVVVNRPAKYKVVRVNGKRYYYWNGRHYRKTRRGYVVVRI